MKGKKGQERARKGKKIYQATRNNQKVVRKIVVLPRKTTQKISAIQKEIVDFLRNNPKASRSEITTYVGSITEDGVKYHLKVLQNKSVIKRIGPDKGGYWKVLSDETSD